jgi:hypothetical protein
MKLSPVTRHWSLVFFSLCLCASVVQSLSPAATRAVDPGQSITDQIRLAGPGDTVLISDGRRVENVNLAGKTDITLRAANPLKSIVAGRITGGQRITLDGLIIENASAGYQQGAVQLGDGSLIRGCIVRNNESAGVFLASNSILEFSDITANGYLGVLSWPDKACVNVTIRNCLIASNNRGWGSATRTPAWADYSHPIMNGGRLGFLRDGKWFANPAWEAGGIKCSFIQRGLVIENNIVRENGGCGIWVDCYARGAVVRGNESFGNVGISNSWEGPGGWDEISDAAGANNIWEGNYFHDNTGGGLVLMETTGVTVRNNLFKSGGIGFRDIAGRTPGLKHISITANQFFGPQSSAQIAAAPAGRNITQAANQIGLAGNPSWTPPAAGTAALAPLTPPPQPLPPPATKPARKAIKIEVITVTTYKVTYDDGQQEVISP